MLPFALVGGFWLVWWLGFNLLVAVAVGSSLCPVSPETGVVILIYLQHADLARERKELADDVGIEREELAQIYVKRGVEHQLAQKVAQPRTKRQLSV